MKKLWTVLGSLLLLVGAKAQTKDTVIKKETAKQATKVPVAVDSAKAKSNAALRQQHDDESPKETRLKKLDTVQSAKAKAPEKY